MWSSSNVGTTFLLIVLVVGTAQSFVVVGPSAIIQSYQTSLLTKNDIVSNNWSKLEAAKGFGEKKKKSSSSSAPPKTKKSSSPPPPVVPSSSFSTLKDTTESSMTSEDVNNPFPMAGQQDLAQGKAALERLRREQVEKRDEELRKVKQIKDVDTMLRESPEAAVIPEKVAQRMGSRMLPFVGIPLLGGMGAFVGFWYLSTYKGLSYEPSVVASSTIALLVFGLLGITYSLMSASWDPEREGSLLGTEEFQRNVGSIKEGLSRSRENAVLRDRMLDISDAELKGLESRDAAKERKQQSFSDKLGGDLD